MNKILFITHDTSRTGAPIILLFFIKWIKKNHPNIGVDIIAINGGELEAEFFAVSDSFNKKPIKSFWSKFILKIYKLFKYNKRSEKWLRKYKNTNYDFVYANTVSSIPLASVINNSNKQSRLVAHIHELETVIQLLLPNFEKYIPKIDLFIAVSKMVRITLEEKYLVPSSKIDLTHEFSPLQIPKNKDRNFNKFIVGASGTLHWRKGGDVFLQVVRYINMHYPDIEIEFHWVGALPKLEKVIIENDIKKLNLEKFIYFTGVLKDPVKYYKNFNLFILPSREDPFPLVCIEMGMMGVPIICFEKATGITEVLNEGGGTIIPYLNIENMAMQIVEYYNKPELLRLHGSEAEKLFSKFTPQEICPQLFNNLERCLSNSEL